MNNFGRTLASETPPHLSGRLAGLAASVLLMAMALPAAAGEPCDSVTFEDNTYTICLAEPDTQEIRFFWRDGTGSPYGLLQRLPETFNGQRLDFAMNAGMYDADLGPIGLYIEDGEELRSINTREGWGNFHLKPNGVFFIVDDEPRVLETDRFLEQAPVSEFATQSGPMLVIDGTIHPRFLPDSTSRKRRNGVGVTADGTAVFAISEGRVTFWEFGRLFRDRLETDNALFLDGTMSSLRAPHLSRSDLIRPMGPMIGVYTAD